MAGTSDFNNWLEKCFTWRDKYDTVSPEMFEPKKSAQILTKMAQAPENNIAFQAWFLFLVLKTVSTSHVLK